MTDAGARPDSRQRSRKNAAPRGRQPEAGIPGLAVRRTAARLLGAVIDARTSLDGLTDNDHGHPDYLALEPRDRALLRAILGTALRRRGTIESLIASRLERPLPGNARALSHILHVAAAQILFLDVPDSAAVNLAVDHAKADPRTARFAALVNGVLRELGRRKERALPAASASAEDAPSWFAERLRAVWGDTRANSILDIHRHEAPMDFTVKSDPADWAERLGGVVLPNGSVRVAQIDGPVAAMPGYEDGAWWVQDAAASLPARLFGDVHGLRVLDLCAAPGGKTAQLAAAGARVTAVDASASRMRRLVGNLARLRLDAETIVAKAEEFTPGEAFDAVLLDAPCSSTGTVRRHPDVPWTKTPEDVERLAQVQKRLLEKAATLVRPGGIVVFSNCSIDPAEGEAMVESVLASDTALALRPLAAGEVDGVDDFVTPEGFLRTLPDGYPAENPGLAGLDGFFAARFTRI